MAAKTPTRLRLGDFTAPVWISALAVLIAVVLITLNIEMLWDVATGA